MFFKHVWNEATSVLFLKGRLHFHHITGMRATANSGAPSVLVAYGWTAHQRLFDSRIPGKLITLK